MERKRLALTEQEMVTNDNEGLLGSIAFITLFWGHSRSFLDHCLFGAQVDTFGLIQMLFLLWLCYNLGLTLAWIMLLWLCSDLGLNYCPVLPQHYGTKPGHFETSLIHFPTSEGVSEVSEWAVRANERTDERVAQYLRLHSCLFQTTVRRFPARPGVVVSCTTAYTRRWWNRKHRVGVECSRSFWRPLTFPFTIPSLCKLARTPFKPEHSPFTTFGF